MIGHDGQRGCARRSAGWALAAALLTGAVAACAGAEPTADPSDALSITGAFGSDHDLCLDTHGGRMRYTEGLDLLTNQGPAPVRIDSVDWSADGVELLEARILDRRPGAPYAAFGTLGRYPPAGKRPGASTPETRAWADAPEAVGAELALTTDSPDHYYNLVIGFRATTEAGGTAGPLVLTYTDADGATGTVASAVTIELRDRC